MKLASSALALIFAFAALTFAADPPKPDSKADPKTPSSAAPKPAPPKAFINEAEAGRDFTVQGEYLGESGDLKLGIQVIALGKEGFRAVVYRDGLPGDGWNGKDPRQVNGKWDGDSVKFTTDDNHTLVIDKSGQSAVGANEKNETMDFKKVNRKSPTEGAKPPQGAIVLFDGSNVDEWANARMDDRRLLVAGTTTKKKFGDCTLHAEFILPFMPDARGQGRANSGVYLQNRYEVQVLDSFGLKGENNECGGIYTKAAPSVNMCFAPLTWQTYDIDFTAAKFDAAGKKTTNARATVKHNGVTIHDNVEITDKTGGGQNEAPTPGQLQLQNHGNPVFFRNVWIVEKQ
ncbi:MAG TPA: DUF1080 domain-containing protein [Tepidisphaeraceae bacterium]|jgi:hypothetical protein|nr:DUF1080 domain-containing protein [Tepidisphaeraceae bacterium]